MFVLERTLGNGANVNGYHYIRIFVVESLFVLATLVLRSVSSDDDDTTLVQN